MKQDGSKSKTSQFYGYKTELTILRNSPETPTFSVVSNHPLSFL